MKKYISILTLALLALTTASSLLAEGTNENFKLRVGTYNIQGASWVRQNYTTLVKTARTRALTSLASRRWTGSPTEATSWT